MDLKFELKMYSFIIFLVMILTGVLNIILWFFDKDLSDFYIMYLIMPLAITCVILFSKIIIEPLANWWLD